MSPRHWAVGIAAVVALGGCGPAGSSPTQESPDRLVQQANDALNRYDQALRAAGGQPHFVPVGELTGQLGESEPSNADNHKLALASGAVVATATMPAATEPTGTVVWDNGTSRPLPLIPAGEALQQLVAAGAGGHCGDCVPLEVTGARLGTMRIQTTRGPATAPAWEYTLKGTAVRLTRVGVAGSATVNVTPPSWDPYNTPAGLSIESATTTTDSRRLTVAITGSRGPRTEPCGADYSAQAVESANAVVVVVVTHPHADGEVCPAIGAPRTTTVDLAEPLGERAVLEVRSGLPVPSTITN